MRVNYVAHDYALGILDYDSVVEAICEDCPACNSEGCPTDGDMFTNECPRRYTFEGLVDAIERVLNNNGIY